MFRKIFIIMFLIYPMFAFGQAVVGIKAGGCVYKISSSLPSRYALHWHAGFFSKATLDEDWALQPELLYTVKGSPVKLNNNSINIKLNYAEFNLLGNYKVYKKLFAEAGFNISYMFKVSKSNPADTLLKTSAFSPLSFGLLFGIGVTLKDFNITGRYDLGLTKLILESDPANEKNPLVRSFNRGFQLSVGFVL